MFDLCQIYKFVYRRSVPEGVRAVMDDCVCDGSRSMEKVAVSNGSEAMQHVRQ